MFNVVRFTKHVIYVKIKLLYYKLILRNIFHFRFWAKKQKNEKKYNFKWIKNQKLETYSSIGQTDPSIHPASQPTNQFGALNEIQIL